jgi:carboxylate-amine ligase
MVRTVGLEEELLLVDPGTREVAPVAQQVLKAHREHGRGRLGTEAAAHDLDQELFRHQVETRTDPVTDLDEALAQVTEARRTAGEAAAAAGVAIVACGIAPLGTNLAEVSPSSRYREMVETYGDIARGGGTCGMHVHVGIESEEEGVAVIDRVAPWLPVLLAVTANSPYFRGHDTGHASWRSQVWSRWPSAGPTEQFRSLEGYRAACRALLDSGGARDDGMLYFDARLSAGQPTVELRVFDVCTDPADAVLVAALSRGLVETAARAWTAGEEAAVWRAEALRGAQWRAARYGLSESLLHPLRRELRPAREVLTDLVQLVRPVLEEAGDLERVTVGVDRVSAGGGAVRQRAAYERTGEVRGVVDDLLARTEASWNSSLDTASRA